MPYQVLLRDKRGKSEFSHFALVALANYEIGNIFMPSLNQHLFFLTKSMMRDDNFTSFWLNWSLSLEIMHHQSQVFKVS